MLWAVSIIVILYLLVLGSNSFMQSQGVHPARNFVSLLFNIPLFGVYFMAIRDMVKVFPSLSSESVLWLDSLSHADPLHILPFVWSGLLLISFEVSSILSY